MNFFFFDLSFVSKPNPMWHWCRGPIQMVQEEPTGIFPVFRWASMRLYKHTHTHSGAGDSYDRPCVIKKINEDHTVPVCHMSKRSRRSRYYRSALNRLDAIKKHFDFVDRWKSPLQSVIMALTWVETPPSLVNRNFHHFNRSYTCKRKFELVQVIILLYRNMFI